MSPSAKPKSGVDIGHGLGGITTAGLEKHQAVKACGFGRLLHRAVAAPKAKRHPEVAFVA